jgi:hypothetical protein
MFCSELSQLLRVDQHLAGSLSRVLMADSWPSAIRPRLATHSLTHAVPNTCVTHIESLRAGGVRAV